MLILRDVVEIETSPERIFDWFRHLDDNYLSWHPAHVSCAYIGGDDLEAGSVLRVEEYLHGRLHRLKLTLTEVQPARELKYRILPGVSGGFRMTPAGRGTELVAELFLGLSIPFLGTLLDAVLRVLFSSHIEAIRQHMREEGINLRALLSEKTTASHNAGSRHAGT